MKNRKKIKELQKKLTELDVFLQKKETHIITNIEYQKYLKEEIIALKDSKINTIKEEIKEDLKNIEILHKIKSKIELGEKLNRQEMLVYSLNF